MSFDSHPKGPQQPKAPVPTENRHIICDSNAFHLEMWIPFYFSDNRVESIILFCTAKTTLRQPQITHRIYHSGSREKCNRDSENEFENVKRLPKVA